VKEGVEILERAFGFAIQAPVPSALAARGADVAVARAGVVGTHAAAARAPEHLVKRLAAHLAVQVPQRDVEGRGGARLHAGSPPAEIAGQAARQGFDFQWIAPEHPWRHILVDISLHALRRVARFSEADQALVGVHPQPQEVGKLADAQRFKFLDPHLTFR
jgi:hypothetical protein